MLQRRPDDFADRNLLLQVALGLEGFGQRLDRLLERHAPADQAPPVGEIDDVTFALLGVIAMRRQLGGLLAALPEAPQHSEASSDASLGSLLR